MVSNSSGGVTPATLKGNEMNETTIYAKSGRKNGAYLVGTVLLTDVFKDTKLTMQEFMSNPVLKEGYERGIVIVRDAKDDEVEDTEVEDTDVEDTDVEDAPVLPETIEELREVADSYGIEYNKNLGYKNLLAIVEAFITQA